MPLEFLYNAASCMVYALLAASFAMLYRAERKRGYLWASLVFAVYIVDILIVFMYDFVPDFATVFDVAQDRYPVFYAWVNICIIALYRMVVGSIFEQPFTLAETVGWLVAFAGVSIGYGWIGGIRGEEIGLACTFVPSVWLVVYGTWGLARHFRRLGRWMTVFTLVLVFAFAACETVTYISLFEALKGGSSSPQELSIEVMALVFTGAACVYLVHRRKLQSEQLRESIVHDLAREFGLTKREEEILEFLSQGLGNREIAGREYVSLSTVKSHVSGIYRKLGVADRDSLKRFLEEACRQRGRRAL